MIPENIQSANPVGQEIVDTISDRKQFVKKVKINYAKKWHTLLSFLFILPRFKKLYLTDPFPGTVYRLLGALIDLRTTKDPQDTEELGLYKIIQTNIPLLINFIAMGLHNKSSEPPQWLYHALNNQFSAKELESLSFDIYRRLDVETFFGITASLRKVQDLNLSLEPEVRGDS